MNQISPKEFKISILMTLILFVSRSGLIQASSSVHDVPKLKTYIMKGPSEGKWKVSALKTEGELKISKAKIRLAGADFKDGEIVLESQKFSKANLIITDAFLGKGGIFNCKGRLELNGKKKELFFDIALDPIKKGFTYKSVIKFAQEDFSLKLYEKKKKAYDDVVFEIQLKLLEK